MKKSRYDQIKERMRELQDELDNLRAKEKELSQEFEALAKEKWAIEAQQIEPTIIPLVRNKKVARVQAQLRALMVQLERGSLSKDEVTSKLEQLLVAA